MSFDWTEFLTLAEGLHSDPESVGPSEAAFRTAVSRAYYAAFRCAVNFARDEGFSPRYTGEDHGGVRAYFRDHSPNDEQTRTRGDISIQLGRLYKQRCKADYSDSLGTRPIFLAEQAIGIAKKVLNHLASLSEGT